MAPIQLLCSTGNPVIDRLVQGIVTIFEQVFPQRVSGYYLLGSYANGSALPASDLDMVMLFAGRFQTQHEFDTAVTINESCALLSPVALDAWVISDERTAQPAFIGDTLELKLTGRLIYGHETRQGITAQPDAAYVRWAMDIPPYPITTARSTNGVITAPVDYPDPAGRFYGYDQWLLRLPDGHQIPGTKLLVASVGRIASALLAYQQGIYVGSKRDCVEQYRHAIADEWTDLVVDVYEFCRNQWGYRIPEEEAAQKQLRQLCRRACGFENHFLRIYKAHLLSEVRQDDAARQLAALQQLGCIIYHDQEVIETLADLKRRSGEAIQRAIETLEQQIGAAAA